jgi:hypothetical protein
MKKTFVNGLVVAIGMVLMGINASADTLKWTTTYSGHTYELWESLDITWDAAETAAVLKGGTLAVFTDDAETSYVYSQLINRGGLFSNTGTAGQYPQAWLGAYPVDEFGVRIFNATLNGLEKANRWVWVTGEAWTVFDAHNFGAGEPNGDSLGLTINRFNTRTWNDDYTVGSYIVEKNGVPDAGFSLALLGGAFAMLGALGRKFRK